MLTLKANGYKLCKFIKIQPFLFFIVDVSATAAAFFGTTVHQVSLRRTVVSKKAAAIAETSTIKNKKGCILMNLHNLLSYWFNL